MKRGGHEIVFFRHHLRSTELDAHLEHGIEPFRGTTALRIEPQGGAPRRAVGDGVDKYWNSASFDEAEQVEFDFSLQTRLVQNRFPRVAADLVS